MINELLRILEFSPLIKEVTIVESFLLGKDEIDLDLPDRLYFDEEYFTNSEEEFFTYENVIIPKKGSYLVLRDDDKIILVNAEQSEILANTTERQVISTLLFNAPDDITVNEVPRNPTEVVDLEVDEDDVPIDEPVEQTWPSEPPLPEGLGEQESHLARTSIEDILGEDELPF